MSKDDQRAPEGLAKHKPEVPAPDRGVGVLETRQADRAIKDALEDDEVREVLRLHHQGTAGSLPVASYNALQHSASSTHGSNRADQPGER